MVQRARLPSMRILTLSSRPSTGRHPEATDCFGRRAHCTAPSPGGIDNLTKDLWDLRAGSRVHSPDLLQFSTGSTRYRRLDERNQR
jgi:hypothetical protein